MDERRISSGALPGIGYLISPRNLAWRPWCVLHGHATRLAADVTRAAGESRPSARGALFQRSRARPIFARRRGEPAPERAVKRALIREAQQIRDVHLREARRVQVLLSELAAHEVDEAAIAQPPRFEPALQRPDADA